jgi:uncharacterized membrane protein
MTLVQGLYLYFDFIVYSFFGWVVQGFYVGFKKHRFIDTGFLYGPYVPIYGFGALLILYPIGMLPKNPFVIFFAAMILTSALEYFTSWLLEVLFHRTWWNYSNRPFNIHGRICLLNSTLYGLAGLFITYVSQPLVNDMEKMIPLHILEIFEVLFTIVFVTDLFFTLRHLIESRHLLQKLALRVEAIHHEFELEREAKFHASQLQFEQWLASRPDIQEQIEQMEAHLNRLDALHETHIAKAFPDSKLSARFEHAHASARQITGKIAELKENGKLEKKLHEIKDGAAKLQENLKK